MPRANIYVKKEDWKKFQEIPDKPQWLHNAINNTDVSIHTLQDTGKNDTLTEENDNTETRDLVDLPTPDEEPSDPNKAYLDTLEPDPNNKNRAYDRDNDEWVHIKYVRGKMELVE